MMILLLKVAVCLLSVHCPLYHANILNKTVTFLLKLLGESSNSNKDDSVWFLIYKEILLLLIIFPSTINLVSTRKDFWSYPVLLHWNNMNRRIVIIFILVNRIFILPKIFDVFINKIYLTRKLYKIAINHQRQISSLQMKYLRKIFWWYFSTFFTVTASSKLK